MTTTQWFVAAFWVILIISLVLWVIKSNRKPKPKMRLVAVEVNQLDIRTKLSLAVTRINIPPGWRFETGINTDKYFDLDGLLVREFDWQAGFSREYQYIYKKVVK